MNDKADYAHALSLAKLKATQNTLTEKVKLLFDESRRLREEISKAEISKGTVATNATKINSEMRELERLQKNIQGELTKLTSAATALTPTESSSLGAGVPTAPPPPPPPLAFHVASKKFIINSSPKPQPNTSARAITGDLLSQLSAGVQLKKSVENTSLQTDDERAQERVNELRRIESSIKAKEAEVERLLNQVSELSSRLETEKASQVEYQQALGSQVEALSELSTKKEALAGKLEEVKEKVGAELSKIEARKAQELAEKERLATGPGTVTLANPSIEIPDAPPPPSPIAPPPPPPPLDNFKAFSKPAATTKPVVTPGSGKEERLSMDDLLVKAEESRQRREAAVVKNYVVNLLIDMVIDNPGKEDVPGNSDEDDESLDKETDVENTASAHQQLFNLIGAEGFSELKEAIRKSMVSTNTTSVLRSFLADAMRLRRGAIEATSVNAEELEKNRDKAPIKDAVAKFIDAQQAISLLALGKEIKQHEDADAARKAEVQKIDEARKAEERARKAAEVKQQEAVEKAAAVQKKLSEMGVKEAVVNTTDVKQAESAKDAAITDANAKKADAQKLDSFLSSIDEELAEGILAVQTADELRIAALAKEKIEGAQPEALDDDEVPPPPPVELDDDEVPPPPPVELDDDEVPPPPVELDDDEVPPPPVELDDDEVPPPPQAELDDDEVPPPPPVELDDDEVPPPPQAELDDDEVPPPPPVELDDDEVPPPPPVELDDDEVPPPPPVELDDDEVPPPPPVELDDDEVPPPPPVELDDDEVPPPPPVELDDDEVPPPPPVELDDDEVPPPPPVELDDDEVPPPPPVELDDDEVPPPPPVELDDDEVPPPPPVELDDDEVPPPPPVELDDDEVPPPPPVELDDDEVPPPPPVELDDDEVPPPPPVELDDDEVPPPPPVELDDDEVPPPPPVELDDDEVPPPPPVELDDDEVPPPPPVELDDDEVPIAATGAALSASAVSTSTVGNERMFYDAREFFFNIKTSIKNKADADNELIVKKANTVESTDDELVDGMEAEQVGAQEVVYKGDFLKNDEVIVAEAELAPGKILHLEQDKSGKVVDRSSANLSVEEKQIAALKQAQMLLNNYDPRKGDIVIRGRDKEQAERIYAAVLHFVKNDPEIKKRMESSRWILPSTFSPEKLIRCHVPGFVAPKTIDSGFIAKHLPIIKTLDKEQLDVLSVSKKAALEQSVVKTSEPIDVVKTQKDFKAQFRDLRQSKQDERPEVGELQEPTNSQSLQGG